MYRTDWIPPYDEFQKEIQYTGKEDDKAGDRVGWRFTGETRINPVQESATRSLANRSENQSLVQRQNERYEGWQNREAREAALARARVPRDSKGWCFDPLKIAMYLIGLALLYSLCCLPLGFGQILGSKIAANVADTADALMLASICMATVVALCGLHRLVRYRTGRSTLHFGWTIPVACIVGIFLVDPKNALGMGSAYIALAALGAGGYWFMNGIKENCLELGAGILIFLTVLTIVGFLYGLIEARARPDPLAAVDFYYTAIQGIWTKVTGF